MSDQDNSMSDQDKSEGLNPDMLTTIYRLAVVILLAGILVLQWQILGNMGAGDTTGGPTWGDLRKATDRRARTAIIDEAALVRVQNGSLVVRGTVRLDSLTIARIRGGQ